MNKKTIVMGVIAVLVVVAGVSLYINNPGTSTGTARVAVTQTQATANPLPAAAASAVSSVPLMQSTGQQFSQYKYFTKAHEIYPALAADTKTALGAFSYSKQDLGGGVYKFTLTNDAEGYKGQSVTVGPGQSVYFIEPATGDDSASEDSITTDDSLVAVDAQGSILK